MTHSGGERPNLTIEIFGDSQTFGSGCDAVLNIPLRHVVHGTKETQIFASTQAAVETFIASGVVSKFATGCGGRAFDIMSRDTGVSACRENKGGEDAKQRRFTGSVGPHNCDCLTRLNRKGNASKSAFGWLSYGLKQCSPAGAGWREKFFERRDGDDVSGHQGGYNRSQRVNPVLSLLYGSVSVE